MSNKTIGILLVVFVVIIAIINFSLPGYRGTPVVVSPDEERTRIEEYVRDNINSLTQHVPEVGGTFYVTDVYVEGVDTGRVEYEDGHVAYRSRFDYKVGLEGIVVSGFVDEDGPKIFEKLGIRFEYPAYYLLTEATESESVYGKWNLTLVEDTKENRAMFASSSPARDGPTSITVDVYENTDTLTADSWVKTSSFSNYSLSVGDLQPTTLAERAAYSYTWSGLYEARSIVAATEDYVYSFSLQYLTPDDLILRNFERMIQSVEFI